MGKTFKDRRTDYEDDSDWRRERQEQRKAKRIARGEYVSKRVERAKWGEDSD